MAQADIKVGVDISDITKAMTATKKWAATNKTAFNVVNSRMKVFGETSSVAFNKFGDAALVAQKKSNRMGVATQQLGYQVSDFIVQVQSGTSAFVAFGQQASQLVGVLPLVATQLGITAKAAIGLSAGLGIIIPLVTAFGAYWMRSNEALDKTAESADAAKSALDSLDKSLEKFVLTQRAAAAGMTVEELLSSESLEQAKKDLTTATKKN